MQDLSQELLNRLAAAAGGQLSSKQLASALATDIQRVVGAIKSLESLGDVIKTDLVSEQRWVLTPEGEEVSREGSHEARLFNLVPTSGIPQDVLVSSCGPWGKVGFSKAMSSGWITIDKTDGKPVVKRKVDSITDTVRHHLIQIAKGEPIDNQLRVEYKKRKLVEEVLEKVYLLSPGPAFTTKVEKAPTELTAEMLATGSWKTTQLRPYNLAALGMELSAGCLHPLLKVRAEYRQIFLELGFTEMAANNYVESSFWNFDALFQPQQHPARDAHDTFFIADPATSNRFPADYLERVRTVHSKGGYGSQGYGYNWKIEEASKNLLRTHTTAVSARMLYRLAQAEAFQPQKYFSIDRVFRNETLDATHLAEFHQIEGVVADYGLTLGDCIGVINSFFLKLGITKLRFKPAYNPYTEPSMEIFSYHEGLAKWVEIGNSGMFRPEMLLPMGLPVGVNVIGFGLSLERPTMIKYKIDNIRDLVGHKVDLAMVKRNPICRIDKSADPRERELGILSKRYDRIESKLALIQQRLASTSLKPALHQQGSSLLKDLVVKASPGSPPYALTILAGLVKGVAKLSTSCHTHSSVTNSGPALLAPSDCARAEADLRLTLIWADVTSPSLHVATNRVIQGEVNIARYLVRWLDQRMDSGLYETRSGDQVNQIDQILDKLASSGSSKHKVNSLVGSSLAATSFMAGDSPSLADILALSLCKQHGLSTPAVAAWMKKLPWQCQP